MGKLGPAFDAREKSNIAGEPYRWLAHWRCGQVIKIMRMSAASYLLSLGPGLSLNLAV